MRNRTAITVVALATIMTLAGCSADTGGGSGEPSADSENEIVIWTDPEREGPVTSAAQAFEDETGVTVTIVKKTFADLRNDFIAQVPTGKGPDITVGAHDWLGALVTAGVVNTLDLGDVAEEFEPVSLDAFTYEGQLYAVPYSVESVALLQNVDMVGAEAPATWDELIQRGTDSGAERPVVINTGGQIGDAYTLYPIQTSFGAPIFVQDETGSYTTEVGMGGPNGHAFATWLADQVSSGYISNTIDYDINLELFNSGKAPFTIQGPWAMNALTDVNVAVNPIPSAGGETASPFVGVQGFYLSAESKNPLVATDFLVNYLATEEAQRALYEADPRIPAFKSLAEEVSSDPILAGFVASVQQGVPMPNIPVMGDVWEFWNAAEAQIIAGEDSVSTWDAMIRELEAAAK